MTRPESWIHFFNGFRSIKRHFNVDWTSSSNLRTLLGKKLSNRFQEWVFSSHRGSKSAKSRLIFSALPSADQDSTEPSSGCNKTRLYSSFLLYRTGSGDQSKLSKKGKGRTMGYAIRCLPGAIQAVICAWSMNSRNSGSCIIKEAGTVAR